jgi:snapalysin
MTRLRLIVAGSLAAAAVLLAPPGPAQAAPAVAAEVRVVYYDASRAEEFVTAVDDGAANWNSSVTGVRLEPVPIGVAPDITVTADDGWPYAITESLGRGRISFGREAVVEGHFPPRIAAHEFGHILGLPDDRTGLCEDLMAGGSAPPTCRNAFPNSQEAAKVQALFEKPAVQLQAAVPAVVYRER